MSAASTVSLLRLGLRAIPRNLAAAAWTYLGVSLASLPAALAAGWLVNVTFHSSSSAIDFARHVDPVLLAGFAVEHPDAMQLFGPLLLGALIFWSTLSSYLTGAIFAAVERGAVVPSAEFFVGGARVFGRLLRLMMLGLPFLFIAIAAPSWGIYKLMKALTQDWISEQGLLAAKLGTGLFCLVLVGWASAAYDLMRIEAVTAGESRARYAFVRGLHRALSAPLAVLKLIAPFALAALVVTGLASLLDAELPRSAWPLIGCGVVLQQLTTFSRTLIRIGLAGAEVAYRMGAADTPGASS